MGIRKSFGIFPTIFLWCWCVPYTSLWVTPVMPDMMMRQWFCEGSDADGRRASYNLAIVWLWWCIRERWISEQSSVLRSLCLSWLRYSRADALGGSFTAMSARLCVSVMWGYCGICPKTASICALLRFYGVSGTSDHRGLFRGSMSVFCVLVVCER